MTMTKKPCRIECPFCGASGVVHCKQLDGSEAQHICAMCSGKGRFFVHVFSQAEIFKDRTKYTFKGKGDTIESAAVDAAKACTGYNFGGGQREGPELLIYTVEFRGVMPVPGGYRGVAAWYSQPLDPFDWELEDETLLDLD